MNKSKKIRWNGDVQLEAVEALSLSGHIIVSPTKVGYIIMTSDARGLERKFDCKNRRRNKPGVVLCGSIEQLCELAEMNDEIEALYRAHWHDDHLLGCILPWKQSGKTYIPNDGSTHLMMDSRHTSCFVIRFGTPSENIVKTLWHDHRRLVFASSANPSGQGNRGLVEGIGERIENEADLIIEANDYVASIQSDKDESSRYEQGVMVSMVDESGHLVPGQNHQRGVSPVPTLIRKGLNVDETMSHMARLFSSWDYRHGEYY